MNKNSAESITADHSPSGMQSKRIHTIQENAASSKSTKRKASLEKTIIKKKRRRVTEPAEACTSSEQDDRVKAGKRKRLEGGEEPSNKKKNTTSLEFAQTDNKSASFLVEAGEESMHAEDVPRKSEKRKASDDVEGPSNKRKRSLDQEEARHKVKISRVDALIAEFRAKYQQQDRLGEGGFGSVYAGIRLSDNFPVAIKFIPACNVVSKTKDKDGKRIPTEVAALLKLASGTAGSSGMSGSVPLLDWYDMRNVLVLVMERPIPSTDLFDYKNINGGMLKEKKAKIIMKQLVNAAKELEDNNIFHRDIKVDNILIEMGSDQCPRARFIDFGLSCFPKRNSAYRKFMGPPEICPPELLSGSVYKAGPTTVWQLGAVLFEILHVGGFETQRFLEKKIQVKRTVSAHCRDFLQTCLTTVPEQRPTLEELLLHPWLM